MKTSEIRKKSNDELEQELIDLRKEQFKVRMQVATQQLSATNKVKEIRRAIARVKTIRTERSAVK